MRNRRAQCPPWAPLLQVLLLLLCVALCPQASVIDNTSSSSSSSSSTSPLSSAPLRAGVRGASPHVTAVVVGATGNLATKYLWVALFRLALRALLTRGESFVFVAGASDSPERGALWLRRFLDDAFERRVCGTEGDGSAATDERTRACSAFYREVFIPSVRYMPLRSEAHYRETAKMLNERKDEAGRLVYLAIPPDYFLQTSELVDRFLRVRSSNTTAGRAPFLRVVIEKPFGTSAESAQALATGIKRVLQDDEVYLMDHYAGKPGVRAWRSYLERNRELLRPLWSSRSIRSIDIEMTETETLQGRIQYFQSTGIVRDVMVNHLHLLLGFSIAPSMPLKIVSKPEAQEDQDRSMRLVFTEALRWSVDALRSWQYREYRAHYDQDTKRDDPAALLDLIRTPTAAQVTLTSALPAWNTTLFTLAAAKAAAERQVVVRITFVSAQGESTLSSPCTLTVVIQRELNAHGSQRIEWSCEMVPPQLHHPPSGWHFIDDSKRAMTPLDADDAALQHLVWRSGDEVTAYDSLLWDAAIGDKSHFADLDEVLAAWNLWTPIAEAAQARWPLTATDEDVGTRTYASGTTPWEGDQRVDLDDDASIAKSPMHDLDEL